MKEIAIKGWLVKDETDFIPELHLELPYRVRNEVFGTNIFFGRWRSEGETFNLDRRLFPQVQWESEPSKVELVIRYLD